jgi:hypothetical protein
VNTRILSALTVVGASLFPDLLAAQDFWSGDPLRWARPTNAADPRGAWVAPDARPGEYCALGTWQVTESMILRREPVISSDSVGLVPALQPFCADSAIVVVDPPGLVVVSRPLEGYPFALGDTVMIMDHVSEGYWRSIWRGSTEMTDLYWPGTSLSDQLVRPVTNRWYVHVRYDPGDVAGWILRDETTVGPGGWTQRTVVGGPHPVGDSYPPPSC